MRILRLSIERFRGIRDLTFTPGPRTVILGPNNAGKSTVLEALDLLLHPGYGRPRPAPTEIDYFDRDLTQGFSIEAVIGQLPPPFVAQVRQHLEGWNAQDETIVPEPGGEGIEPVVRLSVRGGPDYDLVHEFAKPESAGTRVSPAVRLEVGWVFDGRARDPFRQLAFYQGGLFDRLFSDIDLNPAVSALRQALGQGATVVNTEDAVKGKLNELGEDLRRLGLLRPDELPKFEVGSVSSRELLQALQLSLPGGDVFVPLSRQGRGAQRLLLVALLLRLASVGNRPVIGGFEEPEEALEPLRQAQVARMLSAIVDGGGQIFVVTHSPEIARAFSIDDFLLLDERSGGEGARLLRKTISDPVRQKYERWLDRPVVRALFARIPLLVEGPGDRSVAEIFWRALTTSSDPVRPAEQLGLDVVNCEGAPQMPMTAQLLREAGKVVVSWAEQDVPDTLAQLRDQRNCAAILLHDPREGYRNLEQALAQSASLLSLVRALDDLATGRGYTWEQQRAYLVSSSDGIGEASREAMKAAVSLDALFAALAELDARALIAKSLGAKNVAPFEMKGARQGRIVAQTILAVDKRVPAPFERAFRGLDRWITGGCPGGTEIPMAE